MKITLNSASKRVYVKPEFEVENLRNVDIITASNPFNNFWANQNDNNTDVGHDGNDASVPIY